MLVICSLTSACWDKIGMNVLANINTTFTNWSATILDVYTADETRLKVMIYRALWKARN